MYRLAPPTTTSAESYDAAVSSIKTIAHRTPYIEAAPIIQARCDTFDGLAATMQFDQAESSSFDVRGLSRSAMCDLYDKQFTKNIGVERIRSGIKNAAPNGLCPYCGQGSVTQLDHYLPKKQFAGTTVHPANLVPACGDCNFAKLEYKPGPDDPPVLHPYFDAAFSVRWLTATLTQGSLGLPKIRFSVSLSQPDPALEARLWAHMKVFKLWDRFGAWAGQSLSNYENFLRSDPGRQMTLGQVRKDLYEMAIKQSGGRVNSWEQAAHEAMASSDWYLDSYLKLS
ncbi:HNH endonuclease signature motif containing protein [Sinomonas albida]|uniref:HNH endonuclease n=1 Tax=Sinomonas albida TaxID=369942 RepID=UPI00301B3F99